MSDPIDTVLRYINMAYPENRQDALKAAQELEKKWPEMSFKAVFDFIRSGTSQGEATKVMGELLDLLEKKV